MSTTTGTGLALPRAARGLFERIADAALSGLDADRMLMTSMAAFIEMAKSRYALDRGASWAPGKPLELLFAGYSGTLVVISHDRAFLNAIATRVVEVRAGVLREFPGNYEDYLQRIHAEAGGGAGGPRAGRGATPSEAGRGPASRQPSEVRDRLRAERKIAERARRQLERLEAEIATREAELEALSFRLSDPGVWQDAEQARRLTADREALQTALGALYPEWERLALDGERTRSE